uniref:DED domain-containing protein n=1 Tax=Branchiostoma floridae TaxID=7739 RepID=C3YWZ2_BRAFL|eukprot:XP_002599374.1 hypothetical protein BRAFLDRAFT_64268 [Branchiostoma floridae]
MAGNPRQDLYLEISQNLTGRELKDLRTYVSGTKILSEGLVQKANAHQICNQLEKEQKLKLGDLSLLAGLLRKIGRDDYAKKAEKIAKKERKELDEKPKSTASWRRQPIASTASCPQHKRRKFEGLNCTTSADNLQLLDLPPPARHVDHSSLSGLDLAMVHRENQLCTGITDDISTLKLTVRQVQKALKSCREKSQQQMNVHLDTIRGEVQTAREVTEAKVSSLTQEITRLRSENEEAQRIVLEQKSQIQQLQEIKRNTEAQLEYWLSTRLTVEGESKEADYRQEETQSGPLDGTNFLVQFICCLSVTHEFIGGLLHTAKSIHLVC